MAETKKNLHVRTDDNVVVITGEERGKRGRVLTVDREKERITVEGVNRRTRAIRRSQQNPAGGLEEHECPIHVSNVMHAEVYDARMGNKRGEQQESAEQSNADEQGEQEQQSNAPQDDEQESQDHQDRDK